MLDEKARHDLSQAVIVRVTTIQPDGYPHTVPVWFMLENDDMILFTGRGSRKAKNALANPKGAIAFGGDPVGSPCYLVDGEFTVEDDPAHEVTARITHHYETPERAAAWLADWKDDDHVILRLKPRRVIRVS